MPPSLDSLPVVLFLANMGIMLGLGGRLLVAALRTRRAAEAAIGMAAAFGALGVILVLIATAACAHDPAAFPVWAGGRWAQAVGVCGLTVGSWRIYHPERPEAAAVAALACAVALSGAALRTFSGSMPPPNQVSLGLLLSAASALAAYGWGTVEAFRYHRQLQRQLALGLADPVVAHRFLLWAYSGACAFSTTLAAVIHLVAFRSPLAARAAPFAVVQLALLQASVALWFAFYPPAFYRRLLRSRTIGTVS